MEFFLSFIEILVVLSVVIGVLRKYLRVNKLWKRKSEQVVTESISLFEKFLGLFIGIPFLIKFAIEQSISPGINMLFTLAEILIIILIGMGLWVKGSEGISLFKLIKKSLALERSESTDLIKNFLKPKGAEQILEIFQKLAAIDNEISEEEIKFINEFATQWKLPQPDLKKGETAGTTDLLGLRKSVIHYINLNPPQEQATQLVDLLEILIKADNRVTEEEELAQGELTGLLNDYVHQDEEPKPMYEVLLVPQNEEQINFICTLIPGVEERIQHAGKVFVTGRFHSKKYAKAIGQQYINMGIFTVWQLEPIH